MGKGNDAPPPPDPKETSAASTATNVGTAVANAFLGNVNQNTPDGSLAYNQSGTYTWNDPYTGKSYDIPTFTATQTLSPEQQAIKGQSDAAELNLATLANNQSAFLNDYMAKPFSYNSGEHEAWATGLYDQLNNDKIAQDQESLRTRLANQGIKAGSEAYDREMGAFYDAQNNARNRFALDSYNTGFNTATATRNQPINEITALLSGSQVSQPNFVNSNMPTIPTTDVAGIINQDYQNRLAAYNQQQAQSGGLLGGLFGLGGSLLQGAGAAGGFGALFSDERLKEDVEKIGKTEDGIGLYSYSYKADPTHKKHIGVMAQEVQKKRPEAVLETSTGFLAVDYDKALAPAGKG